MIKNLLDTNWDLYCDLGSESGSAKNGPLLVTLTQQWLSEYYAKVEGETREN